MKISRVALVWLGGMVAACGGGGDGGTGGGAGQPYGGGQAGHLDGGGLGGGGSAGSWDASAGGAGGATGLGGATGGTSGAGGAVFDGSAGDSPLGVLDGALDTTPADVDPHGGAKRWIEFGHWFVKCTWFSATSGFCSEAAKTLPTSMNIATDLYQTADGGKTWTLVATIDGKNSSSAFMSVHVLSPTDIWYITGFLGYGFSGSVGHSTNGGATWVDLTDKVDRALADDADAAAPLNAPFFDFASVGGSIWLGTGKWSQYFARSSDGGASWQRVQGPADLAEVQAPQLIATANNLLVFYKTIKRGVMVYRLSGSTFAPVEGTFPVASDTQYFHDDTWWRASPNAEGVAFVDRRTWPFWSYPFAVSATLDAGKTFQTVYTGATKAASGCEGLRDALVVSRSAGSAAFISGVFVDADSTRWEEIRKSGDGGKTWTTVHSEPALSKHTSVALDPTGAVHAVRHGTDGYGNAFDYDAQYVLE